MPRNTIKKLIGLMDEMSNLLRTLDIQTAGSTPTPAVSPKSFAKGPALFKASGRLTDDGVKKMYEFFDKGYTKSQVAKEFGITYRAVQLREAAWKGLKEEEKNKRLAQKHARAEKKAAKKSAEANSRTGIKQQELSGSAAANHAEHVAA